VAENAPTSILAACGSVPHTKRELKALPGLLAGFLKRCFAVEGGERREAEGGDEREGVVIRA